MTRKHYSTEQKLWIIINYNRYPSIRTLTKAYNQRFQDNKSVSSIYQLTYKIINKHIPKPQDKNIIYLDGNKTNKTPENIIILDREQYEKLIHNRIYRRMIFESITKTNTYNEDYIKRTTILVLEIINGKLLDNKFKETLDAINPTSKRKSRQKITNEDIENIRCLLRTMKPTNAVRKFNKDFNRHTNQSVLSVAFKRMMGMTMRDYHKFCQNMYEMLIQIAQSPVIQTYAQLYNIYLQMKDFVTYNPLTPEQFIMLCRYLKIEKAAIPQKVVCKQYVTE